MLNRLAAFVLSAGLLLTLAITLANYFVLSPELGLEPADRLQTSIDVFIASITAIGVVYAGLSLRTVSNAQTDTKSMHETRYVQSLLDEWNLDVERCLILIEQEGIANRTTELLKILWFFEKVSAAMKTCTSLRKRLLHRFAKDYWNVREFLDRNHVHHSGIIPAKEIEDFERLGSEFGPGKR
tara:strand:+ start:4689 stop:5237 length:549 start_codon:yes stop_codon:yes gene_type:complete